MDEYDFEEARKKSRQAQKEYYDARKFCPKCGDKGLTSTYLGYIMVIGREDQYKDENDVYCRCGWKGIYHDLVAEKKESS
jgi:RNA polymerase subunit RPABC4/transcription elongation factor Spt4